VIRVSRLGRVGLGAGGGAVAGAVAWVWVPWQAVPLIVWVVAAVIWLAVTWGGVAGMSPQETQRMATAEDPHGPIADTLLLSASVATLAAVVLGVLKAANSSGAEKVLLLIAGVATIIASWGIVHTVFTLRYAGLYYRDPAKAVDFKEEDQPTYGDFAYLAFTIGMTYQVSDTDLKTKSIRRAALRHALLSYLFGTVIIAATINIAAGLAH
jgi:uncharacterized membrane protein